MATVKTTIGTYTDECSIETVTGTGPYTLSLSGNTQTPIEGDKIVDHTGNSYRFTSATVVEDDLGAGAAPTKRSDEDPGSGATHSRCYSTVALWQGDESSTGWADSNLYTTGDHALGTMKPDSDFTDADVQFNPTNAACDSMELTVDSADRFTHPTSGSGVRWKRTAGNACIVLSDYDLDIEISYIEFDESGHGGTGDQYTIQGYGSSGAGTWKIHHNWMHGSTTSGALVGIGTHVNNAAVIEITNNLIHDYTCTATNASGAYGILTGGSAANPSIEIQQNTIANIVNNNGTGEARAIRCINNGSSTVAENNVGYNVSGTSSGSQTVFVFRANNVKGHNASSDASATGTNSVASISDPFVSGTDFHLSSGSACEQAGKTITGPADIELDIDGQDRTTTGVTTDIGADQLSWVVLDASVGSFTISGAAAGLRMTRSITATTASFTITGTDAAVEAGKVLSAQSGSISISGSSSALVRGYALDAGLGSFAITGTAAAMLAARTIEASESSYLINGTAAGVLRGLTLPVDTGSVTITGTAATLTQGTILAVDTGSFAITGTDAGLGAGVRLGGGSGAIAITGTDVDLVRGVIMTLESGSIAITGTGAGLSSGTALQADSVEFAISGTAVSFPRTYILASVLGEYAITGQDTHVGLKICHPVNINIGSGIRSVSINYGTFSAAVNSGIRSPAVNTGERDAALNTGERSADIICS